MGFDCAAWRASPSAAVDVLRVCGVLLKNGCKAFARCFVARERGLRGNCGAVCVKILVCTLRRLVIDSCADVLCA